MSITDNLEMITNQLGRKNEWHDDTFDAMSDNLESLEQYSAMNLQQAFLLLMNPKGVKNYE